MFMIASSSSSPDWFNRPSKSAIVSTRSLMWSGKLCASQLIRTEPHVVKHIRLRWTSASRGCWIGTSLLELSSEQRPRGLVSVKAKQSKRRFNLDDEFGSNAVGRYRIDPRPCPALWPAPPLYPNFAAFHTPAGGSFHQKHLPSRTGCLPTTAIVTPLARFPQPARSLPPH